MLIPENGGAMVERWWVDNRGDPSSYRVITWAGEPPFRLEGLGGRGEPQV
jgi:hypothetical protein